MSNIITDHMHPDFDEILRQYSILEAEAQEVRDKDGVVIKGLFGNFYNKQLKIGLGFNRAYGSILSGDYFELLKLPGGSYLFIFADLCGHGLPAYTSLTRFRCAVTLSIYEFEKTFNKTGKINYDDLIKDIDEKFIAVLNAADSHDFASVIFTVITNEEDKFHLKFYNRGMHFPVIVRKFINSLVNVYDLNENDKGWIPMKGHLLSADIKKIAPERYAINPSCEFIVYEGDSVLFFSDGIIEATNTEKPPVEFGIERLKKTLIAHLDEAPQTVVNHLLTSVYKFIENPQRQADDMTAVMIDFPRVRI